MQHIYIILAAHVSLVVATTELQNFEHHDITVECRYNAVQYNMILHTSFQ